ncbi:Cytochrome P450 77A3 [Apostasia shenzhenica]|uniref:Cytochrome P450 77A3 n=1 Tax=Apostasia shenzhenica TaxID=1088818 RepID=A0A2I0BFF5_9ASPA|nr:Cytochrome P450 77A3 [Apostasia shenzhenica]
MEFLDAVYISAALLLAAVWWRRCSRTGGSGGSGDLPPGPPGWPVVGNLFQILLQRRPFMHVVRDLRRLYGPIFSLRMGQRTLIVVSSADLIHEALVSRGPLFASRPPDSPTRLLFSAGKLTVNSAPYGPLWRSLRRNLVAELVSPVRVRSFSWIRDWAVAAHLSRLRSAAAAGGRVVELMPHCRLTICSILVCICFGAKVDEEKVREIEEVLKEIMMMTAPKLPDFLPALTPLFRGQLREARKLRQRQLHCLLPLVRARISFFESGGRSPPEWEMLSPVGEAYVDSLIGMEAQGRGKLGEEEMVTLCSEVMSAGTDTSATAIEWAMLHLVLDQKAQAKVYEEIAEKIGGTSEKKKKITEEDVEGMGYLAAVVKETLRRHPPSHFVLSHAATMEAELGGYRVPAAAYVEFYTAWVTEDPAAWPEPEEWRPERFMEGGEGWATDVTGTKGVRMMPFGVGRRICPAASLGMLHVQLLLANMVREFRWAAPPGETPDPAETFAFTVVMKKPLRAVIYERE